MYVSIWKKLKRRFGAVAADGPLVEVEERIKAKLKKHIVLKDDDIDQLIRYFNGNRLAILPIDSLQGLEEAMHSWEKYTRTVHDRKWGWLARLMVFHAIPATFFLWAAWQYSPSLSYQGRFYIGVLGCKVLLYLATVLILTWATPWVLAVDPMMLFSSGRRELRILTAAFVFAPELFPTAQALHRLGTPGKIFSPVYSVFVVVSDIMGWCACWVILENWDSIHGYGEGSGPRPLLWLTAYFSCSMFFAAAFAVISLRSPRDDTEFFRLFSVCTNCRSFARSAIMVPISVFLALLLALEGAGHDFCPRCQEAWAGPDSLETLHRAEERCSVWVSPASLVGTETCTFPCAYGYDGPPVVGHVDGAGHLNVDDSIYPLCHATTTTTMTETSTTVTTATARDGRRIGGAIIYIAFFLLLFCGPFCRRR